LGGGLGKDFLNEKCSSPSDSAYASDLACWREATVPRYSSNKGKSLRGKAFTGRGLTYGQQTEMKKKKKRGKKKKRKNA